MEVDKSAVPPNTFGVAQKQEMIDINMNPSDKSPWPTDAQEQRSVLRWIGDSKFAHGRRYTEAEVYDIVERSLSSGPDETTIRRALIDNGILTRTANGKWYWRADTPEATDPDFSIEQLRTAESSASSDFKIPLALLVFRLLGTGQSSFERHELEGRLRTLGVKDVGLVCDRLTKQGLLTCPDDGAICTVINPQELVKTHARDYDGRFTFENGLMLPSDSWARAIVLHSYANTLDRGRHYNDAQLEQVWRHGIANLRELKKTLLAEGLLIELENGCVATAPEDADQAD